MRLNGWTWLIAGLIIAIVSGYMYLFVPRNGSPNNAMALFFFIGIAFIVTGVIKILLTQKDDKQIMESVKVAEQKIITTPVIEARQNRIEQQINQMVAQQTQPSAQTPNQNSGANAQAQNIINNTAHTNSFYNKYQYSGPVHQTQAAHSTHPAHAQQTHTTTHHTTAPHHIQNAEHGLKCRGCGNVNSAHANYCHQCGHRLK